MTLGVSPASRKMGGNPAHTLALVMAYYPEPASLDFSSRGYYLGVIETFLNPMHNGIIFEALNKGYRDFERIQNFYLNVYLKETATEPHTYSDGFPATGMAGIKAASISTHSTLATHSLTAMISWAERMGAGSMAVAVPASTHQPHGRYIWHARGLGSQIVSDSNNPAHAPHFLPLPCPASEPSEP